VKKRRRFHERLGLVSGSRTMTAYKLAKLSFWLNRFRTLPRAKRLFSNAKRGTLLERKLFGYDFFCDVSRSGPQATLFLEGERSVPEARLVKSLLQPGFHVVDAGANIGYYVLLFAQMIGPTGSVIAIEPSPENLSELYMNINRNRLTGVIKVIDSAVGNRSDFVGLRTGINSGVTTRDNSAYTVRMNTLDEIITGPVDFIKIDVEGYEYFVLEGALRILRERRPILFLEVHPAELASLGLSATAVIRKLKMFYSNISLFYLNPERGLTQKIYRRYLGHHRILKVLDVDAFLNAARDSAPFWAVCKPSGANIFVGSRPRP